MKSEIKDGALMISADDGRTLEVRADTYGPEVQAHAALFGLQRKLTNFAALSRDPETGRSPTDAERMDAVMTGHGAMLQHGWTLPRGEGTPGSSGGLLYRAMCRVWPERSPEVIRAKLASLTPAQQAALRLKHPGIKAAIDELKAEDAAKSGQVDDLSDLLEDWS